MKKSHSFFRWVLTGVGIVVALAILLIAAIFLVPQSWLNRYAAATGSAQLGRALVIDGPITIDWDWTTPHVHVNKIRLANVPDKPDPDMVVIDNLEFGIKMWKLLIGQVQLPTLTIDRPTIILEKYSEEEKNWQFPVLSKANAVVRTAVPQGRSGFPVIGVLKINEGKLVYRDMPKKLAAVLTIDTASGDANRERGQFILSGDGALQDKPFSIRAAGGSLDMLRNSSAPYPLDMSIKMGATQVSIKGSFTDPVNMAGIDATLNLKGDNMADLFYLTFIPLPPTPAYSLSGHLEEKNDIWSFRKFHGRVGDSDLSGDLTDDVSGKRGFVQAELTSKLLDMKDIGGLIGIAPPKKDGKSEDAKDSGRLLPDMPLSLERLRATDMDVRLKADQVSEPGWPMNAMNVRFLLKDGVLRIDPLNFGMANGRLEGAVTLNGQKDVPKVEADMWLKRLSMKPFFNDSRFEEFAAGHFGGHIQFGGAGRSMAEVLGSSDGRMAAVMSGGKISLLIVKAAGLELGEAAPLLLDEDESTAIRCAVGDFKLEKGMLNSDIFVFDTAASNIGGSARVNLKDETIDMEVESHPKDPSILTAHASILITGKLKSPVVAVDPKELAARGGVAAALGVFLTPVAGIIPFIEMGLGEDSDCRGLIEAAHAHSGASPPAP
ncbi:MAG: AsmA family protein [Alphaproteobacteria bacterium]